MVGRDERALEWLYERLTHEDYTLASRWRPEEVTQLKQALRGLDRSDTEKIHQVFVECEHRVDVQREARGFDKSTLEFFRECLPSYDHKVTKTWEPDDHRELMAALKVVDDPYDTKKVHQAFMDCNRRVEARRGVSPRRSLTSWLQIKWHL